MPEFIYTMSRARKSVGDKVILDDVTMSFFPGAKIGMVGPNGAGKSTILKIMAGLDQPSNGEVMLAKGATVGILLQEPPLDETKTVLENVQEGAGEIKAKVDRYNEIAANYSDETADEMARLQDAGVSRPPDSETDWNAAADAAERYGMNRLAERLREMAG